MLIIRGPIALYTIVKDCCRRPCLEQHFSMLHPRSISRYNPERLWNSEDQLQVHNSLIYRSWCIPISALSKCLLEVRLTSCGFQFLRKHTWCMTCLRMTVRKTGPRVIRSRCTPLSCNFMQRPTTAKVFEDCSHLHKPWESVRCRYGLCLLSVVICANIACLRSLRVLERTDTNSSLASPGPNSSQKMLSQNQQG